MNFIYLVGDRHEVSAFTAHYLEFYTTLMNLSAFTPISRTIARNS